MKKIYILGSYFYGYEKEIINEIQKKYEVIFINYRLNIIEFFMCKILFKKFQSFLINRKIRKNFKDKNIDVLLFIGGEELHKETLLYLQENYKIKKYILYLWDNIERVKTFKEIYMYFDKIYSFDNKDCKKYNLCYRPTFYSNRLEKLKNKIFKENINIFFIGIYRKNRLKIVEKMYANENFIYLYYPKLFFYLLKILRKDEFIGIDKKYINFQPIKKEKYNEIFKNSKYILDIPEKNQTGLTQRILDALFLGKKIITTQKSISEENFYNPNNILIIESYEDIKKSDYFFKTEYEKIPNEIINYYSIENWVKDILE